MWLVRSRLDALVDHPQIDIIETSVADDNRLVPKSIKLSNEGWAGALKSLLPGCPTPKNSAMLAAPSSEAVAKQH